MLVWIGLFRIRAVLRLSSVTWHVSPAVESQRQHCSGWCTFPLVGRWVTQAVADETESTGGFLW